MSFPYYASKQLTIAIDFDNTFTADSEFFSHVILRAQMRGHRVIILTGRSDEGQMGQEVRDYVRKHTHVEGYVVLPPPIVFAGNVWKREAARKAGYQVDIFIDDMPEYIAPQAVLQVPKQNIEP